jgi:hypothetical protein
LPVHDFQAEGAPRGMKAVCRACGSAIGTDAAKWYLRGASDALASVSRAARVRAAEIEIARERARQPSRVAAGEAGADDDDGDGEAFDDAS